MKILKFNENVGNWNKERIYNFVKEYTDFTDKLEDFISYEEELGEDDVVLINNIYRDEDEIVVEYNDESGNDLNFGIADIDELARFMNDPELFKSTNKYNL